MVNNDSDDDLPFSGGNTGPRVRGPQVSIGTTVDEAFREEVKDLARAHRLHVRELLKAMVVFWQSYLKDHPDFDPKSFRDRISRKL